MTRKVRNTAILAKIEPTYGIDAVPTGAANALLISEATFDVSYNNVDRNNLRGYMGGNEQLAGTRFVDMTFSAEFAGSGALGTAPAWGPLLQGCAFAEVVTASTRVEYNPISTGLQSLTIYYFNDGVLHKALGCMGTVTFGLGEGERPMMQFSFSGLDGGPVTAANPATVLTAWKSPLVITDTNSGGITLGGAYAAGAITGGTAYPSRGMSLDIGNQVAKIALLGGQAVDITNRSISGSLQLQLTAAEEVSAYTDVNANTLTSLSLEHGTAAGAKIIVHLPNVQRTNPKHVDYEGRIHMSFDLRSIPLTGNDELRIVAL